jgi:uncharacterized protein (UPF0332 family)
MDMNDLIRSRMQQARESLDEAGALLDAGMDHGIVLTNVYYAFYYPVIAAVYEGRVPDSMQSVTLGLFEERYVRTGLFKKEQYDAIRQVFEIKPKCSGICQAVTRAEIERFLDKAREFITAVETFLQEKEKP